MGKNNRSYRPSIYIGLGVFISMFLLSIYVTNVFVNLRKERKSKEEINVINAANLRLQENLYRCLTLTKTLNYIVERFGFPNTLDSIGNDLIGNDSTIKAIQLLKEGKIILVYPLKGNEAVIGYDILKDTNRNIEALQARESKDLYFAGPFKLKQGGEGIVGRLPIFIDQKFVGFSAVVIRLEALLKRTGISPSFNPDYVFQLTKVNPNTHKVESFVKGVPDIEFFNHSVNVNVPMGNWNLFVARKDKRDLYYWMGILGIGFLLSIVSGYLAYILSRQPVYLRMKIEEKVTSLYRNENLLDITQTTAMVGSWEINIDKKTIYCTELTKSIYGLNKEDAFSFDDFISSVENLNDRMLLKESIYRCAQGEGFIDMETKIKRFDGVSIWVKITGRHNKELNDLIVFGATQDINELIDSKAEKLDILDSINDAFIACNEQKEIVYVNRTFAKMIHQSEDEILDRQLSAVMDEDIIKQLDNALQNNIQSDLFIQYYSNKWQLWIEASIYFRASGFSIYLKNVTLKMQHLKALEQQNKKLKQIAWMQSHVIRAPLVKILYSIDLIQTENPIELNHRLLKIIKNSSQELDTIINEISNTASEEKND